MEAGLGLMILCLLRIVVHVEHGGSDSAIRSRRIMQVWTAVTALAIASTLAAALRTEAHASGHGASKGAMNDDADDLNVVSVVTERPLNVLAGDDSTVQEDDAEDSLRRLLPFQVDPAKLAESLQAVYAELGGAAAASAAQGVDCMHSSRVHLIVAQVLTSGYVVRSPCMLSSKSRLHEPCKRPKVHQHLSR